MTTSAVAFQEHKIEVPVKANPGECFVFFAGNLISSYVRDNVPDWSEGGLLKPGAISLQYRNGYIRQCEITQLREQMVSENAINIAPAERKHLHATYVEYIGDQKVRRGVRADGSHDGLLRTRFYPMDEVEALIGPTPGLVRMPVKNVNEAMSAQYFLFPHWDEIKAGVKELPTRIPELLEYFKGRLKEAGRNEVFKAIATAAIKSCEQFATWAKQEVAAQNAILNQMRVKGFAWSYGDEAECIFEQFPLRRQDNLVQEQADSMAAVTQVLTKLTDATLSRNVPVTPDEIPPEKLGAFERFLKWEAEQAAGEYGQCIALVQKTGVQCKNVADADDGFCRIHRATYEDGRLKATARIETDSLEGDEGAAGLAEEVTESSE